MKTIAILTALLALTACGIDGRPSKPAGGYPDDGIAGVGVVGSA